MIIPLKKQLNRLNSLKQLQLRSYQKHAIGKVYYWFKCGKKSVMLVSPTGSGKTLTAVHIIRDALFRQIRILFIVHREPLVEQTVQTLINYGIDESLIGYIKAGYPHCSQSHQIIVASIQTLARRDYPANIGLVIFDECHTTSFFQEAKDLINYYAQSPIISLSKVKFLHLTATPFRTQSKEYFGNHIECIVRAPSISELIQMGYLVNARHFGYGGLADFSLLETDSDGDFKKSQMGSICEELDFNQQIVDRYLKFCPDRKTIVFCASVAQSILLTQLFNHTGITAEHIQAETPHDIRRLIYTRFKEGTTKILSSVGTLTEGFDEPSCEAVILARPTKSLALLIQMCGRGLRIFPGKQDCFLLDFGENFKRLGRIDRKHPITLCPNWRPSSDEEFKECPDCHAQINKFLKVCPECGYEFPPGKKDEPEDNFLQEFGELLDPEIKKIITYIRAQRKSRFTRKLPPDPLWELWSKNYPQTILCNDWLYQATFRGDRSESAQQAFLNYLHAVILNPRPDWIRFHMAVEFGDPNHRYESKSKGTYSPPPFTINRKNWWEILRVNSVCDFEEIKRAYSNLSSQIQSDDEMIKLLNWAYDSAKQALGIYEWDDVINGIDTELKRIGWDVKKAQEYLLGTYGKKSRKLLTDSELIEFWDYLETIEVG